MYTLVRTAWHEFAVGVAARALASLLHQRSGAGTVCVTEGAEAQSRRLSEVHHSPGTMR